MNEVATFPGNGHNSTDDKDLPVAADTAELREKIHDCVRRITQLKDDRRSLNSKMKSLRDDLAADGVVGEALKRAIVDDAMTEEQLTQLDVAYKIARAAVGKAMQPDLFLDQ